MQYVRRRSVIVWVAVILALYLVLTKIDLIVHYDLYQYGLRFDLQWANPYWFCLTACFWGIAALAVTSYWLESRHKNKYLCALIALTILIPYYFGFEDVLWFISRGGFPAANVEWDWFWLNNYFPPWTTAKHITYSVIGMALLAAFWGVFLGKKLITFDFNYLRKYKPSKRRKN
ncbi:MAG: hypothetical protein NWF00_06345 [Candidatus Bathyarchaeota archaeon]|nr:hypothetical protein [Candidatus Bathyarchaeota archaeon]